MLARPYGASTGVLSIQTTDRVRDAYSDMKRTDVSGSARLRLQVLPRCRAVPFAHPLTWRRRQDNSSLARLHTVMEPWAVPGCRSIGRRQGRIEVRDGAVYRQWAGPRAQMVSLALA